MDAVEMPIKLAPRVASRKGVAVDKKPRGKIIARG